MNKYKGILFDLDGTLLDTANDLGETLNYILTKYNQPKVARERYRPIASDGAKGLLELGFSQGLKDFNYDTLRAEFLAYYHNNIADHTTPYKGIEELIRYLVSHNIPWGIVTNKPIDLTLKLLPFFPIFSSSQSTIGGDSLPQRKPHPAPLIEAAKQIGVAPEDCVYLGDAPRDIEAANAAGMYSIIANWGYIADLNECSSWQADHSVDSPEELFPLF